MGTKTTMTDAAINALLASQDAHLRERLAPWIERCTTLIRSTMDNAAAHALNAITETLRRTPDGRATDRKAVRSRSFVAAIAQLDGLVSELAGPSSSSLDGLIRDAREAFYRDSFGMWKGVIPEATWVSPDAQPTMIGVARMRGVHIHGADVRIDIASAIGTAKDDLRRSVNAAAGTDSLRSSAGDRLATWKRMKGDSLVRAVSLELSDSDMIAHTQSGIDLVHEKYR